MSSQQVIQKVIIVMIILSQVKNKLKLLGAVDVVDTLVIFQQQNCGFNIIITLRTNYKKGNSDEQ